MRLTNRPWTHRLKARARAMRGEVDPKWLIAAFLLIMGLTRNDCI